MPFRDLITGDETWVCLDMKPRTVWIPDDAELPIPVKRTIASEKCMLIVFWGIHGIAHYCWLPKDRTVDSPLFCEEVLSAESIHSENAPKFQKFRKPLIFDSYGQCKGSHGNATQEKLDVSRFKRTPEPPYSPDIAPSDFFFSAG
jgi:hypothetical protein